MRKAITLAHENERCRGGPIYWEDSHQAFCSEARPCGLQRLCFSHATQRDELLHEEEVTCNKTTVTLSL